MRIRAAGKTWIVEERPRDREFGASQHPFLGVTFRNADHEFDELQVPWVLKPERFTPHLAHELFEIAGLRLWRDPRTARVYRVCLETLPAVSCRDAPVPIEAVRFEADHVSLKAPWTLGKALGWASDAELMALLDGAAAEPDTDLVPID